MDNIHPENSNLDSLLAGDDEELKAGIARLVGEEERAKPIVSAFYSVVTVEKDEG